MSRSFATPESVDTSDVARGGGARDWAARMKDNERPCDDDDEELEDEASEVDSSSWGS